MSARTELQLPNIQVYDGGARDRLANAWKSGFDNAAAGASKGKEKANQQAAATAQASGEAANASSAQTSQNMKDLQPGQSGGMMMTSGQQGYDPNSMPGMAQMQSGIAANTGPNPYMTPMPNMSGMQSGVNQASQGVSPFIVSDEEQKIDIHQKAKEVKEMLDNLKAYSYKYKDSSLPGTNPDTNLGIMAQDLEKSKLGQSAVTETDNGKMLNTNKTVSLAMAALATLNKRLNKLEGKK